MLARQLLFDEPEAPLVADAAGYLADFAEQHWPQEGPPKGRDYYLWYNCTLAMFLSGGRPWERWNDCVRDTIIKLQDRKGCQRGSWDPTDRWGSSGGGGRIYSTALAILTLGSLLPLRPGPAGTLRRRAEGGRGREFGIRKAEFGGGSVRVFSDFRLPNSEFM